MVTVKAKAECATCGVVEEFWATIDVDTVDESDTFSSHSRPVLTFNLPEGWGKFRYGSRACHCPKCLDEMPANQSAMFVRF